VCKCTPIHDLHPEVLSERAHLDLCFSYVLGAVFLQLCQTLLLGEHPIVQKLVDPSLFIHRFTERKLIAYSILSLFVL
jgi:hypothetical protein